MSKAARAAGLFLCSWALIAGQSAVAAEDRSSRPDPPRLDYVVERVEAPDSGLRITLAVTGTSVGRTTFAIYETWGGAPDVAQEVREPSVLGGGRRELAVKPLAPHRWSVDHAPDERLELTYRLRPASADSVGRHRYLPVITDDLALLVGHTALVHPDRFSEDQELDVRIRFEGFDAPGWRIVTSFGPSTGTLRLRRPLGDVLHAFYAAGKLRVHERQIHGRPLHLAVAGEAWRFEDASFADMVTRIMTYQREFHGDLDHPPYTVCLVPYPYKQPDSSSSGGSCLTDSFILYLTPRGYAREGSTGLEPLETLIAHEYFHNWNAPGPDDDAMHWFSEGFTVFYERRVLLRLGLFDLDDYVEHLNRTIRDYMTSPVKSRPNADYVDSRMLDRELESLPYTRGAMIAVLVDDEIRRISNGGRSLDELMRERAAAARAWAAGLRDGQRLVGWSVRHGDADTAVELGVVPEGGKRKKVTYMPQAMPVAVPQFSLREGSEALCREFL